MKKRLIVLAMILSLAIFQGGLAWATEDLFAGEDQQLNNIAAEQEQPVFVNIIRPLGEVVTDANLFISARIFNGAKAKLYVYKEKKAADFSFGLNLALLAPLDDFSEELIYESELIERRDDSLFYFEEAQEPVGEEVPQGDSADAADEIEQEPSEEAAVAEKLGEVFGITTESGIQPLDEGPAGDVLFYYKKIGNIEPGKYTIRFEVVGADEEIVGVEEKKIEVKDLSSITLDEEEIKKEVFDILSNSFTGIISR